MEMMEKYRSYGTNIVLDLLFLVPSVTFLIYLKFFMKSYPAIFMPALFLYAV